MSLLNNDKICRANLPVVSGCRGRVCLRVTLSAHGRHSDDAATFAVDYPSAVKESVIPSIMGRGDKDGCDCHILPGLTPYPAVSVWNAEAAFKGKKQPAICLSAP